MTAFRPMPIRCKWSLANAVLADLVRQVGGDLVQVHALVRPGVDVHTWQSSPSDSVRIAEADLVVSNGANLAAHVEDLLDNAASADAIRVVASEGLEAQELVEMPFPEGGPPRRHGARRRTRR